MDSSSLPLARVAIIAIIAGVLALPASASADVVCVNVAPPTGCDATQPTIQDAVDIALSGDTVKIGPQATPYAESVAVTDETIHFEGAGAGTLGSPAGPGDTVIQGPPSQPAVRFLASNEPTGGSMRGIRVLGGDHNTLNPGPAILLDSNGDPLDLDLTDVVAVGGSATSTSVNAAAALFVDVLPSETAPFDVTVVRGGFATGGGPGLDPAINASGSGSYSFDGTTITTPLAPPGNFSGPGIRAGEGEDQEIEVAFRNGLIDSHGEGISVSGVALQLDRSVVRGATVGVSLGPGFGGSVGTVTDSVVESRPDENDPGTATAVSVGENLSGASQLIARNSTFVGRGGTDSNRGVEISIVGGPFTPSADLRNTVAFASGADAVDLRAQAGTITAQTSSFTTTAATGSGSVPAAGSGTNVAGDPQFQDFAGGDYTPGASSPLLERADASLLAGVTQDVLGNARTQDANGDCNALPDIGAIERAGAICVPAVPGGPSGGSGGPLATLSVRNFGMTNRVFAPVGVRASQRRVKRGTTFRYTLSDAARVTITIERPLRGRRRGRRCVAPNRAPRGRRCTRYKRMGTLTQSERAGAQTLAFSGRLRRKPLAPGRYRARMNARTANGVRSSERTITFRIVRP